MFRFKLKHSSNNKKQLILLRIMIRWKCSGSSLCTRAAPRVVSSICGAFLSYLEYAHDNPPFFLSVFRVALIGDEDRYQYIWFYYICWSSIATVLLYHKHVFYSKSAQIPKGVCFTIYITHIVLLSVLLLLSRHLSQSLLVVQCPFCAGVPCKYCQY